MENYIVFDGRKFGVTDSFVEALRGLVKEKEESPFAQIYDKPYYFITSCGDIDVNNDSNGFTDDNRHRVANYCADEKLMRQRALHETLNRLLWRFNEMHGGDVRWDGENCHFYIVYNKIDNEYRVCDYTYMKPQGVICFSSKEFANRAIDKIVKPFVAEHPDFMW